MNNPNIGTMCVSAQPEQPSEITTIKGWLKDSIAQNTWLTEQLRTKLVPVLRVEPASTKDAGCKPGVPSMSCPLGADLQSLLDMIDANNSKLGGILALIEV